MKPADLFADTTDTTTMSAGVPLRMRYADASDALCPAGETPLALIGFGNGVAVERCPSALVATASLDATARAEVWSSELAVQYDEYAGIRYATSGEILFGVISDPVAIASAGFETRVRAIYDAMFALIDARGFPQLLRVWNYFPDINGEYGGLENYQRFCRARAAAFQDRFSDFIPRLPSASAIGTQGGELVVYFIAAREPGLHRENPRQVSAYAYPSRYGPRSPSFARATLKRFGEREVFFISGTASIVGHESLHRGDVLGQLDETLRNIEALIESTGRDEGARFRGLADISHMKVYLRRPSDLAAVQHAIKMRVGADVDALYLHGDICRQELLVEIEAVVGR